MSLHFVQQSLFIIVLIENEIIFILWCLSFAGFWFLITLIIIINCQLLLARLGALFVMIQRGAFYFQLAECQSVTSVLQHDFKSTSFLVFHVSSRLPSRRPLTIGAFFAANLFLYFHCQRLPFLLSVLMISDDKTERLCKVREAD